MEPPTDDQRRAFVQQLGQHFPELAAAAADVTAPRPYVPPPVVPAPAKVVENEGVKVAAPPKNWQATPAMVPGEEPAAPSPPADQGASSASEAPASGGDVPPPPPMVDPSKVKYE